MKCVRITVTICKYNYESDYVKGVCNLLKLSLHLFCLQYRSHRLTAQTGNGLMLNHICVHCIWGLGKITMYKKIVIVVLNCHFLDTSVFYFYVIFSSLHKRSRSFENDELNNFITLAEEQYKY